MQEWDKNGKKKILFLNTVYPHPAFDEILKEKPLPILSFSAEACIELRRRKVDFHYADDFVPVERLDKMEQIARTLSEDWEGPIRKALTYRKVPLGQIFSREFSQHLRDTIKSYYIVENALEKFSPEKVVCSPPIPYGSWSAIDAVPVYTHLPSVLRSVCEAKGIDFEFLERVENRQFYEERRENRFLFDMAVKGRNTGKWLLKRLSDGSKKKRQRILSVILKKGMFETIKGYADGKGVDVISYYQAGDLFRSTNPSDLEPTLKKVQKAWDKFIAEGQFLPSLPEEMAPIRKAAREDIAFYISSSLKTVMKEIDQMESVLTSFDIDLVLCLEDFNPLGKARVAKAEALGIPSVVVQHGIFPSRFHIQYSSPRGRYNFLWGPAYIETFVHDGFPKDRIFVTGTTSVDVIYSRKKDRSEIERVFEKLGIPKDKKTVLWTNTPMHISYISRSLKKYLDEIRWFFDLMQKREETLVVKTHQLESPAVYKAIAKELDYEPVIADRYLPELIFGSDVVVISNSTVGLQALIAGKPIILYTTQREADFLRFVKDGAAEPAFTLEDLPKALDKVLYGKKYHGSDKKVIASFLENYAARPDGSGMTSVIDKAMEILKSEKKKAK